MATDQSQEFSNEGRYLLSFQEISSVSKATAIIDEEVLKSIDNEQIKPRRHPGVLNHGPFALPQNIKNSVTKIVKGSHKKQLLDEAKKFRKFLLSRGFPVEPTNLREKTKEIEAEVEEIFNVNKDELTEDVLKRYNEFKNIKVKEILRQRVYNWHSLNFTDYLSLLYLVTRSPAEYAAVLKVFTEINTRSPFQPTSIFDFGSGVGTVTWAANNVWGNSITEYYCVDSSSHMINLSETILKESFSEKITRRVFHRQFLPSSTERSYDIVVCAYALLEQPSRAARLETIKNLLKKTSKYLVIIEFGTNSGFKVLNEARDFLLSEECKQDTSIRDINVFAPCPHNLACPRVSSSSKTCYFPVSFYSFPQIPEELLLEHFSYVVIEKGTKIPGGKAWPRIVQPVLQRSRHVICRFCCDSGELKEVVVTPTKHGKAAYRCAKSSRWGDLFPCSITENKMIAPERQAIVEDS